MRRSLPLFLTLALPCGAVFAELPLAVENLISAEGQVRADVSITYANVESQSLGAHFPVIGIGQQLALLRPVLPAEFAYPDWQAALSIGLISIMAGLGARNEWIRPHDLSASSWFVFLWGFMVTGGCFLLVVSILRWWVPRQSRSLGNLSLFKVLTAAWLLPAVLGSGLLAVGLPAPWAVVIFVALGITSLHAMRCATPCLPSSSLVAGLILACGAAWLLILVSRVAILSLVNGW